MPDEEVGWEIWKQIEEFPNYWVSDYERVMNMKLLRLMKLNDKGYFWAVTFSKDGKEYERSVRKLVMLYHPDSIHVRRKPFGLQFYTKGVERDSRVS